MGHTVLCASRRISSVFAPPSLNLKILLFSCAYMQNEPHSRSSQEQGLILQFALHVRATPESSMHSFGSLHQNKVTKRVGGGGPQGVHVCGVQPGRLSGLLLGLPSGNILPGDVSDHLFAESFFWVVAQ